MLGSRLGERGGPALAETTEDGLDGKPRQTRPKEGNRVYNPIRLGTQSGSPGQLQDSPDWPCKR
jgi:hypothetical protein